MFTQDTFGEGRLIDNQPQDAKIRGVGEREGTDINSGLANRPGHLGKTSRFVFDKDGNLFNFHGLTSREINPYH